MYQPSMKTPEQIAAETFRAWWEREDATHPQIIDMIADETHGERGELFALVEAAALAALTEREMDR